MLLNFYGKIASYYKHSRLKKIAGSFSMPDWLENSFSSRKSFPLAIFVYCLHTTPGHVTKTVYGYAY